MTLEILESISQEVQLVETSWVFKPSLKWQYWLNVEVEAIKWPFRPFQRWQHYLVIKAKEVNWPFKPSLSRQLYLAVKADKADLDSKSSLKQLLYSAVARAGLIFYRFHIPSTWELSRYVKTCLVKFFLKTYQVS